jgi:hypothetical protein
VIHAQLWQYLGHRHTAVLSHGSLALETTYAPGRQRKASRGGYILRRLGLGLMGLVLSLMLAEAALRLVHPIPPDQLLPLEFHERRLKRLISGEAYVAYDAILGWVTARDIRLRTGDII